MPPVERIKGIEQLKIRALRKRDKARKRKKDVVEEKHENHLLPTKVKVLGYKRETRDDFYIKVGYKGGHEPGQFVQLGLPGYGEAPISICSYSDEFMEFNIREVGNVTKKLGKLKKGYPFP